MTEKKRFFITGTDTEVGKTSVSAALLSCARQQGFRTLGLKPLAAGCERTANGLRNEDAEILIEASTCKLSYLQVNPVALEEAIAPHIAAQKEGRRLSVDRLVGFCRGAMTSDNNFCVVEGAGGWRVPINTRETMADFAKQLNIPVILVVGIRLGCINHALLTAEAIVGDGLELSGWVANVISEDMAVVQENVDTLVSRLPVPCLGQIPYTPDVDPVSLSTFLSLP